MASTENNNNNNSNEKAAARIDVRATSDPGRASLNHSIATLVTASLARKINADKSVMPLSARRTMTELIATGNMYGSCTIVPLRHMYMYMYINPSVSVYG